MMAAMDSAECSLCILSREKVAALVLFVLTIFGRVACGADSGLLCYSCTNVPHPRDCNRIMICGPNEACSVESFLTPSGTIVYNMGCSSQLKCHNSVPIVGRRESMLPAVKKRADIRICIECCTNNSFCNRQLCDTKVNLTGKLCMKCDDVVTPKDCSTVALCQAGEICYTESKIILGEKRYRLGCVKETSCQQPAASETITTINPMSNTCGVCCKREIENCNLELCDQHGGGPLKDTVQMYLVDPPIDTNVDINGVYCHDESETGCILLGAERPNFCDNPSIKNHVCPKFCGTCGTTLSRVESSTIHTNPHPTDTTAAHPTKSSTTASISDCFFRSSVYIGRVSTAIGNIACDRWDAHLLPNDSLVSMFPDQRLEDALNYCRDPDGKGHPWCYVKENPMKSWEFCDVPYCPECYFANRSHDYNGYVTTSMNGKCLAWTGTSFPDSSFPDGSVARAKNYCRDPDNRGYPHCLTSHGLLPCLIPKCNDSVCQDDPSTLCESLKLVICGVKDMAQKLCPKTCGMCGFSLMPPVHIKPPVHNAPQAACKDNPMAKCDTLKQFICGNAHAAQLCPKTCNLCPECFFRSYLYLGLSSKTIDNITCDRWDAHLLPNDPLISMFPDQRLEDTHNYCRDPDNKGHPWCYITGHPVKSWEFCDVPYCQECYYQNQSHAYNGYVSSTNHGECLNWAGSFPNSFFIDGSIIKAKNYCRDPDHTGYPYCITSSGFVPCMIPLCQGTCEDDPNTRCEDLKLILCQSEHLAVLFCPKSCNMCGFGLTEPVHVPPPVLKATNTNAVTSTMSTARTISTLPPTIRQDICEDSVNFSCNNPDIKAMICIDKLAATNYCRKTCNLCGTEVLPLNVNTCGDPIKELMCKALHEETCLCYDKIISSVLCPRYCANQCGPVNGTVSCPEPDGTIIVGRR